MPSLCLIPDWMFRLLVVLFPAWGWVAVACP